MSRIFQSLLLVSVLATGLAGCDSAPPYSNVIDRTGRGVGFSDYAQYMRAQEELSRLRQNEAARARTTGTSSGPQFAQGAAAQPPGIAAEAVAAVRGTAVQPSPQTPQAPAGSWQTASLPGAQQPTQTDAPASGGPTRVSDQQFTPQPFGTPQQNRVVTRDFVPQVRVSQEELGTSGAPNLFVYALSTQHQVGEQRFTRRNPLRWQRWESACAQFANQDLAQEAFLAAGGPERDPNNLDPDGDGFACWWDPVPFRQAVTNVRARQ